MMPSTYGLLAMLVALASAVVWVAGGEVRSWLARRRFERRQRIRSIESMFAMRRSRWER